MNYEEKLREIINSNSEYYPSEDKAVFAKYFPELKEPEDERLRKGIIRNLQYLMDMSEGFVKEDLQEKIVWLENQAEQSTDKIELNPAWSEKDEEMLKWLCRIIHTQRLDRAITLKEESELGEWIDKWLNHNLQTKQSEQSIDKIEPKFKPGDFIMNNDITEHGKPEIFKVIKVCSSWYDVENVYDGRQTMITFSQEYTCHLWTINDAKQCDVNKMSDYEKIKNATMAFLNGCSYDECIEWLKKQKD